MSAGMTGVLPAQGRTRVALVLAALLATTFVVLAVIGAMRMYTPVPFWDMWDGTLGFYMAISDGANWLWWAQHNEHRIILSRLLFWLDYKFFGGLSVFLLMMNYVFVALAVVLFRLISAERLPDTPHRRIALFLTTCFLIAWLYQWMQHENLAWGFQSQFFLAQLLPLGAFYWLHKSARDHKAYGSFLLACLLGFASAGTMANGVLALPLMAVYALITRMRVWQLVVLFALGIGTLALYFQGYQSPGQHVSIIDTLMQQPWQVIHFVLLYLGTPFFNLLGRADTGAIVAMTSTAFMAMVTLQFLYRSIRSPHNNTLALALVFGIVYFAGTALGTATGRVESGVYQAVSFRYATPALMAWACLLLLLLPWLWQQGQRYPRRCIAILVFMVGPMLSSQWEATKPQYQLVFDREQAGLALTLGIRDEAQIQHVFMMTPGLMRRAEAAEARKLGMFSVSPWRDLKDALGDTVSDIILPQCTGHLDVVSLLGPDDDHIAVQGWLFNLQQRQIPKLITLTDTAGVIKGYALTGQPRSDVAYAVDGKAYLAGFRGYIPREFAGEPISLIGDTAPCQLTLELPVPAQIP